jgi:hypothetical protein
VRRLLFIVLLLLPAVAGAQPVPTAEWVSFWSDGVTFNARAVAPGSVVRAYDPDGVLCGEFLVTAAGSYGLMAVYRDDPFTPGVDEGAEPGDVIDFEIDGAPAEETGPGAAVWTFNGAIIKVGLAAEAVLPTAEWVNFWSASAKLGASPAPPGAIVRAYDPEGALCGEFVVTVAGNYGLMAVYRDDPFTPDIDEGANPGELIRFTIEGTAAVTMGPDTPMWGANGQIKRIDIDVPDSPSGVVSPPEYPLAIHPNAPNPFGGHTVFGIEVTGAGPASVTVYDVRGRVVRRLVEGRRYGQGAYRLSWDGRGDLGELMPKGVYLVELTEGTHRTVRKMTVVR